jgi:hypothetical protein
MVDGCHTAPRKWKGENFCEIAMRRLAPSSLGRLSATENDEIVGIGDEVRSARFAASGTQSISAIGSIGKLCHDKPA